MSDIVERLREAYERRSGAGHWDMMREAADEIERLRNEKYVYAREEIERLNAEAYRAWAMVQDKQAEIEQLRTDKEAISQTASGYLHEIERLQEVLRWIAEHSNDPVAAQMRISIL